MGDEPDLVADAERAARDARRNRAVRGVARSGYGASAVVRLLIGVFALLLAVDAPGPDADVSGVFGALADLPGGVVLLVAIAVGELALGGWLVLSGLLRRTRGLEGWRLRSMDWGRAVVYLAIGSVAVRVLLGVREASARVDRAATRLLLDIPGGSVVLAGVGAIVVVAGVGLVWIGLFRRFRRTIHLPIAPGGRRIVEAVGVVGHALQGATIAGVGVVVIVTAVTLDRHGAVGLDATLVRFASAPGGRALLAAIGVGWIAAGAYAGIRAFLARLD